MGLIIKIHRADGTLDRVISREGNVDVMFYKGIGHKSFMRFDKNDQTDVDFDGPVSVFTEMGAHLETISPATLKSLPR